MLILSDLVKGSYNFTLNVTNKQNMWAMDTVEVTVLPNPLDYYMLQVHLEGDASTFTLMEQVRAHGDSHCGTLLLRATIAFQTKLERVLQLILDDISVDYDIIIEEVRPFGPHVRVEFYAVRHDTRTPINATLAYAKLTEKGQDYYYPDSNFHFVKINMKGVLNKKTPLVAFTMCHGVCSVPAVLFRQGRVRHQDPQMQVQQILDGESHQGLPWQEGNQLWYAREFHRNATAGRGGRW